MLIAQERDDVKNSADAMPSFGLSPKLCREIVEL